MVKQTFGSPLNGMLISSVEYLIFLILILIFYFYFIYLLNDWMGLFACVSTSVLES